MASVVGVIMISPVLGSAPAWASAGIARTAPPDADAAELHRLRAAGAWREAAVCRCRVTPIQQRPDLLNRLPRTAPVLPGPGCPEGRNGGPAGCRCALDRGRFGVVGWPVEKQGRVLHGWTGSVAAPPHAEAAFTSARAGCV